MSNKKQEEQNEDLVDPLDSLRDKCGRITEIKDLYGIMLECTDRVNSKTQTNETCEQELFDYVHALDHCVAKTLFSKLK